MRTVVEIAVSMGWLPVNTGDQLSPIFLHMDVKKGDRSLSLFFHGELDLFILAIQMFKECTQTGQGWMPS